MKARWVWVAALGAIGCGQNNSKPFDDSGGTTDTGTPPPAESSSSEGGEDSSTSDNGVPKLDIYMPDLEPETPDPSCDVVDDMDAIGDCDMESPPDSFEPDVQWSWDGGGSIVTPLVANLTDDNADGSIDLCDVPDIVVVTEGLTGTIHVLSGDDGHEHFTIAPVQSNVTPAIGDIDGDGEAEIVAGVGGIFGPIAFAAYETDGTQMWQTEAIWQQDQGGAIAIADVDNDGSPEIIADGYILRANGDVMFSADPQTGWILAQRNTATIAADLDGDADLEIILGQSAYHHTGEKVWVNPDIAPGYPQVANLDDDDDPEVIVNNAGGITVVEHDGTVTWLDVRPTGDVGLAAWFRPSTVHDFDGDNVSEFAVSSAASYSVFEPNMTVNWTANVQDASGWAAGTAFDFLGDGVAEAMYADERFLFIYGDGGSVELQVSRSSKTLIEYPVVADVDNDGSAEIVVVSNPDWDEVQSAPTVQVIRDIDDRWIQARRIWNQHTYHVTNVREDGTIPKHEPPSWLLLNTYRTNAQIENGEICDPDPEG